METKTDRADHNDGAQVRSESWLDCPLCEEKPDWWGSPENFFIVIQCDTCEARTKVHKTFDEAGAEWNKMVKDFGQSNAERSNPAPKI